MQAQLWKTRHHNIDQTHKAPTCEQWSELGFKPNKIKSNDPQRVDLLPRQKECPIQENMQKLVV